MNPALLQATGLPRRGLVAFHDLWFPNCFLQSVDLTSASWTKAKAGAGIDPVVTAGQNDPDGGTTAFRLQLNAGGTAAGDVSLLYQSPFAVAASTGWWVKSNTAESQVFGLAAAGSANAVAKTATTTWQFFSAAGGVAGALGICARPDRGTDQALDLLVWHPQAYPAATLPAYAQTTTLQSIPDLSGRGNVLTRGSNASVGDSNDPTVLGPGLSFVTDDYALTGNLSSVTMVGPWTVVLCGLHNGVAANKVPWALAENTANADYNGIRQTDSGHVHIRSSASGSSQVVSDNLAVSTTFPSVLALTLNTGVLYLTRLDTGSRVSVGNVAPLNDAPLRIGLGCVPIATPIGQVDFLTSYSHLFYNRVLSTSELQRAYRYLKAQWASRGIAVL